MLLLAAQSEQKPSTHAGTNELTSKIDSKVVLFVHKNSLRPDYAH